MPILVSLFQNPSVIKASNQYTEAVRSVDAEKERARKFLIARTPDAAFDSPLGYQYSEEGVINSVVLRDDNNNFTIIPRYPVELQVRALLKFVDSGAFSAEQRIDALNSIERVLGNSLIDPLPERQNDTQRDNAVDAIMQAMQEKYRDEEDEWGTFMRDIKWLDEKLPGDNPLKSYKRDMADKEYEKDLVENPLFTGGVAFLEVELQTQKLAEKRLELMVENAVSTTDLPDMREADRDDMKREVLEMIKDISMYGYLGDYIKKVPQAVPPGTTALADPPAAEKPFPDQVIAAVEAMKVGNGAPIERTTANLPTLPVSNTPYLG
ncbi:MAG: hypothetical protein SFX19_09920 [Alphaproteobacteria bacterium]|nr:hypothetical protein [Alphaproteobacteria bacterium]